MLTSGSRIPWAANFRSRGQGSIVRIMITRFVQLDLIDKRPILFTNKVDVDSKIQNPTVLEFSGFDSTYSVTDQNIGASVEQHRDGRVHVTSVQRVGNNLPLATMIFPQRILI
ncbi:unnamed protein product [Dovyalis caffra]|uniref:Uncharacterized protein n=1 Tax=Dovyalis caffra TaxID=77055 RepID=A0AAV1RBR5_9ROSI|nr:unnamed protein product [Dovyalis caffra]